MGTTETKLNRLKQTKSEILTAIQMGGVEVPSNIPFKDFSVYIKQLSPLPQDTTELEDLMVLADLYYEVNLGLYEDKTYSLEEQNELMDLVDLILEGEIINE